MATGNEDGLVGRVAGALGVNHAAMKKAGYARPIPQGFGNTLFAFTQKPTPNVNVSKLPQQSPAGAAQPTPAPSPGKQAELPPPVKEDTTAPQNTSSYTLPGASPVNAGLTMYNGPMLNSAGTVAQPMNVTQIQPPPMQPGGFGSIPLPPTPPGAGGSPVPQNTEQQLYQNWLNTQQGAFNPTAGGAGSSGGYSNPLDPKIQDVLSHQLDNPSRYDMPLVKDTFDMLNRQLSEGYNTQANQVDEEMARRGLFNSTTAGGRLGDLRTNQARAQADMAQNLLMDQARTYSQDLNAATGAGMDFGRYGQNADQMRFNNQAQTYGMNADQNQRNWQNYSGFGQQAFDNQMRTAQFNQNQDQINNQLLLQLLGGL